MAKVLNGGDGRPTTSGVESGRTAKVLAASKVKMPSGPVTGSRSFFYRSVDRVPSLPGCLQILLPRRQQTLTLLEATQIDPDCNKKSAGNCDRQAVNDPLACDIGGQRKCLVRLVSPVGYERCPKGGKSVEHQAETCRGEQEDCRARGSIRPQLCFPLALTEHDGPGLVRQAGCLGRSWSSGPRVPDQTSHVARTIAAPPAMLALRRHCQSAGRGNRRQSLPTHHLTLHQQGETLRRLMGDRGSVSNDRHGVESRKLRGSLLTCSSA